MKIKIFMKILIFFILFSFFSCIRKEKREKPFIIIEKELSRNNNRNSRDLYYYKYQDKKGDIYFFEDSNKYNVGDTL